MIKKEIQSRIEVEELVRSFYTVVREDSLLGPVFNLMIRNDEIWEHHFGKLIDFWEVNLLKQGNYEGAMIELHIWVDMQTGYKLGQEHLDKWLSIWHQNLNDRFFGTAAELAHKRADAMGKRILERITKAKWR